VLLYLYGIANLWQLRAGYQDEIGRLEPRIARWQGLTELEEQLRDSAGLGGNRMVGLVYPAQGDNATAAASLQKDVRQLFSGVGMEITNSQVLPVRQEANFDYIGVKLTVSGDIASLDAALAEVADFSPLLLVEGLDVWPMRVRRDQPAGQRITANLRLLSLRAAL
jgi:general secretion pathway protein M